MKYQTVDLPNGMNFHARGPISVRHNDLVLLHESRINDLLVELQLGQEFQWVIYVTLHIFMYLIVTYLHVIIMKLTLNVKL